MSLKSQIEAIIYAAEEPVTQEQMLAALRDDLRAAAQSTENGAEPNAAQVKATLRAALDELLADYGTADRGMEIRQVAGGYRMSTKPEHHDVVRSFARNLKPPVRLSLPALETLAVIAYKQPITVPEISEIRGVDSGGVIATLLDRKLITTAGRKQVIGRPILYRTTKDFLLRFGLGDIGELPSMEEFEKLAAASLQSDFMEVAVPDATGVPDVTPEPAPASSAPERPVVELGTPDAEVTTADS
jgi:segregation and condensation protein B